MLEPLITTITITTTIIITIIAHRHPGSLAGSDPRL
jgi:hypothetical protein